MIYHVSVNGCNGAAGTAEAPFKTINHAAQLAVAGDTVVVHSGVYREWVDPKNGGEENKPIIYTAAEGERPIIKGSEIVTDWERVRGTVWKTVLSNDMFGDYNPYSETLWGDWLLEPSTYSVHTGDVYLNGRSLYEAESMEALYTAEIREVRFQNVWRLRDERLLHPEDSIYQWYATVDDDTTTVYCNFQDKDPNCEQVEINVRKCCFYPTKKGLNYITVRGFEMAHAACGWNPPTAEQIGMVGPNWSKGWMIENCDLHDAKTSAICIGKEGSTGHNESARFDKKSGHIHQAEAVYLALQFAGWSRENIGSHIIRNNEIHDCGQNGVVGHLGCIFSRIEHNHIYNIGVKHEFWGHEMAGVKLHAAIDVVLENNNFHNCVLGTWLDWEAQGTRVTRNLYYNNERDFMIEVTHGPCTVDHNLFLSDYSLDNHAQGTAFVHNVIAGLTKSLRVVDRNTPYHLPHSTAVLGYMPTYGGDDRIINNLILGHMEDSVQVPTDRVLLRNLGRIYDDFTTPEEYQKIKEEISGAHGFLFYYKTPAPVWIEENAYSGHGTPFRAEQGAVTAEGMDASVEERDGKWILTLTVPDEVAKMSCRQVTTERLGTPRATGEPYENPDGTPIDFGTDFFGNKRNGKVKPGPFARLDNGKSEVVIWKR